MLHTDIPPRFPIPFGASAAGTNIRAIPVTTTDPIQASLTLGFPPETFQPLSSGGAPPDGRDFNGVFNQITQWSQWQAAGGPTFYDATFSTSIGGYPAGAVVASAVILGYAWISLVDNNVTNPDAGGAGWQAFSYQGSATTGDVKFTLKTAADPGWLMFNDGTIGDAGSNASFASATAFALYVLIYNGITDSWAQLLTQAGAATTRAAQGTAAQAWANKCRVYLTQTLGRSMGVAGASSTLSARALGQTAGSQTVAISQANFPSGVSLSVDIPAGQGDHAHDVLAQIKQVQAAAGTTNGIDGLGTGTNIGPTQPATLPAMTGTAQLGGSAIPLPMLDPTVFLNCMVKL